MGEGNMDFIVQGYYPWIEEIVRDWMDVIEFPS